MNLFDSRGRPVMSCCGARNPLLAVRSQDFDRCHSFLLASSAPGGARKRPRFGNPPYKSIWILSRRARQVKMSPKDGKPLDAGASGRYDAKQEGMESEVSDHG